MGIAGQVVATFGGPVGFVSAFPGPIAPVVSGDSLIWNVSDFGTINSTTDFAFILHTAYGAQITDQVCLSAAVSILPGDNNPSNNNVGGCYPVYASWDPNSKEVSPSGNVDTTQPWLTYTIHFQNTGSASATNIHVDDTIDVAHLDISTFQLLAYSSLPKVQIQNNGAVRFTFSNINLPDSSTGFAASQGYVQYKIKLIDGVPVNTQISNTASVYFDLNPAVVTNTTLNTVVLPTGITPPLRGEELSMKIYPNPANTTLYIKVTGLAPETMKLYTVTGQEVYTGKFEPEIDVSKLSAGAYFVEVKAGEQEGRRMFVKGP